MSAQDRYLANYRSYSAEVWCANQFCPNHEGLEVMYVSEYGQGCFEPGECPSCGGVWLEEQPVAESPFDPEFSEAENRGSR